MSDAKLSPCQLLTLLRLTMRGGCSSLQVRSMIESINKCHQSRTSAAAGKTFVPILQIVDYMLVYNRKSHVLPRTGSTSSHSKVQPELLVK